MLTKVKNTNDRHQLIQRVKERFEKDYDELIADELKGTKEYLIRNAYEIAHYNEIRYTICDCIDDEDEMEYFNFKELNSILNYQGNVVLHVYQDWQNYTHPEIYNFFCFETLIDVIKTAFK